VASAAWPERGGVPVGSPAWCEERRARRPREVSELIVELRDPRAPSRAERIALAERLARANIAIYCTAPRRAADREVPLAIGAALGLRRLDRNWLGEEDGLSSITAREQGRRGEFIPYTTRALRWHTDGYYNPPHRRVRAFILHCVRPAAEGGETLLLDHALAYARLAQTDPAGVAALMRADAMTIPARVDENGTMRPAQTGPVFFFAADGALEMRYTARPTHVRWAECAALRAALRALAEWLESVPAEAYRLRLEPGMGVIANNVLHARTAFRDEPAAPRLLYRARYYERACA